MTTILVSEDGDTDEVLLQFEKHVCSSLLNRLFDRELASLFLESFYPTNQTPSLLLDDQEQTSQATVEVEPEPISVPHKSPQVGDEFCCRLDVINFECSHYAKSDFPPFTIRLVQLNGDPIEQQQDSTNDTFRAVCDLPIRLTLLNKWADVTEDVLPGAKRNRSLHNGRCVVSDFMFHEISLKHGGFFTLVVVPLNFETEVREWRSPKITIQSVKTHSNHITKTKRTVDSPKS
eukprot:c9542_g1_i2.p1 GENE.c9542_g1_i2~~c9542_g1_i2.p1  ORF type:complete len:233 (-),score=48.28 c9542_g1_i2:238-936(-)